MRFSGTYLDASGQNHLRARQYDAATGGFTSPDSAGSASAYGYAEANPMVYADPLGTDVRDFVGGLRAASGYVMAVGGLIAVAVACTPLVTCAGAVATFAAVLVGVAGTVHAGTSIALAYDSCARGKGSCVSDVVQAGLSVGVGGYGYSMMRLPAAQGGVLASERAGAESAANGQRLRAQLTGDEIAGGHAFDKHVVKLGEFPGITTRGQFARTIEDVVANGEMRTLSGGRTAYWNDGTVVIRNPGAVDGGTALRPRDGYDYFLGLL